jgi:hypothetical protein
VPFHTATELLLKLPPFMVRTKPAPPAVALLGESELTDGVDGQEQEMIGSRKVANMPRRGDLFVVAIVAIGVPSVQVTSYTTTSTTFVSVDSTNLSYTVTIPTGYNLLINAAGNAATARSSANEALIALFDGSTALTSTWIYACSDWVPWALTWVIPGNGASHTIHYVGVSSQQLGL